ncbi:glycosyltransferase [Pseudoduganella sp. GCM10020061]|uniref:MraY family glycosyltransferase n=1 Tax=Pseudoduganella sp. GCM10020061 TaxID=3317345 RepID=UPI0036331AC6
MGVSEFVTVGVIVGFAVSIVVSLGLVLTTRWHGKYSLDQLVGIQKFHAVPTPRIGGLAIFAGLVCACLVAAEERRAILAPILVAGLPAFCFGVAEDVTKRVSVRARLLATMASGIFAWYLTGASVTNTGVWGVDSALGILPISVIFTAFAVSGVANAVNIIDGFNGLASGSVMIALAALGLIALNAGDTNLALVCFIVCGVTLGFFLLNFPFGKLFLGDGGAYLLGFILAWLAVMLPARNPSVSAWAPFLVCGYPVFETVFTIIRRVLAKADPGQPDGNHLHTLIKVKICMRIFRRVTASLRNASVSPFSWAVAAVPAVLAVQFSTNTAALMVACLASFLFYVGIYLLLANIPAVEHVAPSATAQVVEFQPGQVLSVVANVDDDVAQAA